MGQGEAKDLSLEYSPLPPHDNDSDVESQSVAQMFNIVII